MHFNLDNKEYSFTLKNKEKKRKSVVRLLCQHTLFLLTEFICRVLVFGGAKRHRLVSRQAHV